MLKKIGCLFTIVLVVAACSSKDSPDAGDSSDRVAMLTNVGNNVILPSFQAFSVSAKALTTAANDYAADNQNEQKLIVLQNAWINTAAAWKTASLFTQGPIEDDFLSSGIYFTSTNYAGIEKSITQTTTTIDNAYIESLGATFKGIPAIEYMLFGSANSAVLAGYAGSAGVNRTAYLKALCQNLENQATLVLTKWSPDGGNYVKTFIAADGRDINSSLGILSNKMIDLIYTIKDERLGAPLGKRNNGTPQPDLVDAKFSNASILLMKAELKSLENAFTGKSLSGTDGAGFDDILDAAGAKSGDMLLSVKIKNQFALVGTKLDLITNPLATAVTSQTAVVSAAYDEVKKLQVMMEVDMINNLGVLLTFSDNDGD